MHLISGKNIAIAAFMFLTASCSMQKQIGKQAGASILKDSAIATGNIGICIYEPASGKYWYNYNSTHYFIPASNTKLFTLYAGMKYLGEGLDFEVKYFLKGDATKDETLLSAGVENARALIITLPVDADNLFVVLTAKQLNPAMSIISRASQDTSIKKLKIAGASSVIMPDKIGGAHMATLVMLPDVVEMLSIMSTRNNADFKVAELVATNSTSLETLNLWQKTNCTILGIKNAAGEYNINPPASYTIATGDRLIVMGSNVQIESAKKLL